MTEDDDKSRRLAEKRGHPRHQAEKNVRVEVDGEVIVGQTKNISLSGVAINSLGEMSTEQFVKLHLEQFGRLDGHVVRQFDDGFAVEFETLKDNGSVLEDKIRSMLGNGKKSKNSGDQFADERTRMENKLKAMFADNGDD